MPPRCWTARPWRSGSRGCPPTTWPGCGSAPTWPCCDERPAMTNGPLLRRTGVTDLLAPFAVVGVVVYLLLKASYEDLPPLRYLTAVPILALAVAELVAARRVRGAVRHQPGAKPMAAIVIARCVALGKASSLVGAGVVG